MKAVGINGYGTIGKRVADAVAAQDDMKIVGVTKRTPNFEAKRASELGYDIYMSAPDRESLFDDAGIKVKGTMDDFYDKIDIVVDCTPGGVGAKNMESYKKMVSRGYFKVGKNMNR